MEFPLTKYVVVCVFSVVFISLMDALTPKQRFYEVYTKHKEEVDQAIGKWASPLFKEAVDALCRCLFERTMFKISSKNKSIHAIFSKSVTYNFVYEKPLQNIQTSIIGCQKNNEYPDIFAAFSNDEDELFNVRVFRTERKTGRIVNIIKVDGLKDNDQAKLSSSPYWCRIAAVLSQGNASKADAMELLSPFQNDEDDAEETSEEEGPTYQGTPWPFDFEVKKENIETLDGPTTSKATTVQFEDESDESSDSSSTSKKTNVMVEIESDESSDAPISTKRSKKVQVVAENEKSWHAPSTSVENKMRVKEGNVESLNAPSTSKATTVQLEEKNDEFSDESWDASPTSKQTKVQVDEESDESIDAPLTIKRTKVQVVKENGKSSDAISTSNKRRVRIKKMNVESSNTPSTCKASSVQLEEASDVSSDAPSTSNRSKACVIDLSD